MMRAMINKWSSNGIVVAAVAVVALGLGSEVLGQLEAIAVRPITERHIFTDDVGARITLDIEGREENILELEDASRLAVVEFTIQPGAVFPWHTHPGPVLANVTRGELIYVYADDCIERPYAAGTAFVDPGNSVHTAFNPSDNEEMEVVAVFFGTPEQGLLTIPVAESESVSLDNKCGIDRESP